MRTSCDCAKTGIHIPSTIMFLIVSEPAAFTVMMFYNRPVFKGCLLIANAHITCGFAKTSVIHSPPLFVRPWSTSNPSHSRYIGAKRFAHFDLCFAALVKTWFE